MKALLPTLATIVALNAAWAKPLEAPAKAIEQAQRKFERLQQQLEAKHRDLEKHFARLVNSIELAAADAFDPPEPPEPPEPPDLPDIGGIVADGVEVGLAAAGDALARVWDVTTGAPLGAYAPPLIVPGDKADPAAFINLQEDLVVMSRILDKTVERAVGREKRDQAMGIVLWSSPGRRRPQSLYLDGYGAVFFANVKFPLVPPATKAEKKVEEEEDSTWEEAKREVFGRRESERRYKLHRSTSKVPEYDAGLVEKLKDELLAALKNASNLRDLKADEQVVIVVAGASAESSRVASVEFSPDGKKLVSREMVYLRDGETSRPFTGESMLILRAKKSDVDHFAKGKLDLDDFRKKVQIQAY